MSGTHTLHQHSCVAWLYRISLCLCLSVSPNNLFILCRRLFTHHCINRVQSVNSMRFSCFFGRLIFGLTTIFIESPGLFISICVIYPVEKKKPNCICMKKRSHTQTNQMWVICRQQIYYRMEIR